MSAAATKNQILLARVAVGLTIAFLVAGAVTYGFSAEVRERFWLDLLERPDQLMRFRFVLQPIMAAIAALHDGREDARLGRSPYIWALLSTPSERVGRLAEGVISTEYHWGFVTFWSGNFAVIAGATREGKQTPLLAVAVVLASIGVLAFFAVLLRLV